LYERNFVCHARYCVKAVEVPLPLYAEGTEASQSCNLFFDHLTAVR